MLTVPFRPLSAYEPVRETELLLEVLLGVEALVVPEPVETVVKTKSNDLAEAVVLVVGTLLYDLPLPSVDTYREPLVVSGVDRARPKDKHPLSRRAVRIVARDR